MSEEPRGITPEELQEVRAFADKLEAEGKLRPVKLESPPDDVVRIVWREPEGQRRRCSTFIPLPDGTDELRAALQSRPGRGTVYTYAEAKRLIESDNPQPSDTGRYEEALREIAAFHPGGLRHSGEDNAANMAEIAQAALQGDQHGE